MTKLHDAWLARQRARWMRPNAHLWMRPDAHRFLQPDAQRFLRPDWKRYVQPGFEPLFLLEGKANFNPDQPRVPAGNPDGGQWTNEDGGEGADQGGDNSNTEFSGVSRREPPGIGHNQGPPFKEPPPQVPQEKPASAQEKNAFLKDAAYWLSKAIRAGARVSGFLAAIEVASWLDTDRAFIDAYQDPPKPMKELQESASESKWGYHKHHVAEKSSAREDGFPNTLINGSDNLVRIPALKHWQITGWYMTPNERFGGLSPREYLRKKDWEERQKIGREALIKFGVLKP